MLSGAITFGVKINHAFVTRRGTGIDDSADDDSDDSGGIYIFGGGGCLQSYLYI